MVTELLADLTDVERVALLGLRLRALDARSTRPILNDVAALTVADAVGLDLSSPRIPGSVVAVHAVRAATLDTIVRRFTAENPDAVVVELGCGLDTRQQRCAPPPGITWYDVDSPAIARLRRRVLPTGDRAIGVDIEASGWLDAIPGDRPTVLVADGLMALLTGAAFTKMTCDAVGHFTRGEIAFNAYSRLAMRNSRRIRRGPLSIPARGEGVDDPREPEAWDSRLRLIEELSMARAPEADLFPPVLRAIARVGARSARMVRAGDRVLRFGFSNAEEGT